MRSGVSALARFGALAALALACRSAEAGPECAGPLSPCINDDTLWPHAGPGRFVAIGSTETTARGQMAFGLVTTYLSRPIVLHLASPGGHGTDAYVVNDQVDTTFLWAYGVSDRLELDAALPLALGQGGSGLEPVTGGASLRDTALRDLRFGFTYALVPHERNWGLSARFEMSAPTGDRDQFAGERSGVYIPSMSADYGRGSWFAGGEIGARIRPTSELLGARVGTEVVTALGAGYDILPDELLTAMVEAWALPDLAAQANGSVAVPAEWQLSVRTSPIRGGNLSLELGGGGPLEGGAPIRTPRFRFTFGVRWAPRPPHPHLT
ncbi:MAG: transporter, partial [Polyangiaceae bacterium]